MKKNILKKNVNARCSIITLAIMFTLYIPLIAQWEAVSTATTADLKDLTFPASDTGYIVGDGGSFLKTTDGGVLWQKKSISTFKNLKAVHFFDATNGIIGGDSILLRTSDGGDTWTALDFFNTISVFSFFFINDTIGFCGATNGNIYKTLNGGQDWVHVYKEDNAWTPITCIYFTSKAVGYAVRSGYGWEYLKTMDGGSTWESISLGPDQHITNLESIFFTNENIGYIGGWYLSCMYKTTDGGLNWADKDHLEEMNLYDIRFLTSDHGYAVGWHGTVYRTNDAGETWEKEITDNILSNLHKVRFTPNVKWVFACGEKGRLIRKSLETSNIENEVPLFNYGISVFPNPSADFIYINGPVISNSRVRFFSLDGRLLQEELGFAIPGSISLSGVSFSGSAIIEIAIPENQIYRTILLLNN